MPKIVALGSVNADLVVTTARTPHGGETVTGDSFNIQPGGKGANQAVAAARLLPGEVAFIGRVGTDGFASMLTGSLRDAGVALDGVQSCDGSSGVAFISVERGGQNRIVVVPGANAQLSVGYVHRQQHLLRAASVVLLQLETPIASVASAARIAHEAGATVILDPAPAQPLDRSLLQNVTWLTPNYSEACALTGLPPEDSAHDIAQLLEALLNLGPQHVLLKLGESGLAVAMRSGEHVHFPAYRVNAVDTTARG